MDRRVRGGRRWPGPAARRAALLVLATALLAGCASLPDMAPYRDATVQLRSTVLAGGGAVQAGLETAAAAMTEDAALAQQLRQRAQQFGEDWRVRVRATDALVAYAEAVAGIARAGTEGAASARALADALVNLAGGVGIAMPPLGTVAAVTDVAAFVYGHIAAVRAAPTLEQALLSAQPAVDRVATLLAQDLRASADVLRAVHEMQRTALALRYNEEMGFLKALERERKGLYARGALGPEEEQRLQRIAELQDATRGWREPMEAAVAALEQDLRLRLGLIEATRTSVAEWAAAHRNIAAALREKRGVNVEGLVQATLEARELVRRLRLP